MHTCIAIDRMRDCYTNLFNVTFPSNQRKTGSVMATLDIKIGTSIMLTRNIDVSDSVTSGAVRPVIHVVTYVHNKKTVEKAILVVWQ